MLQCANYAGLITSLPTVEEVLDDHASNLGNDFIAYRNHVYRVMNLCLAIVGDSRLELEKVAVASVFHDLGIWTNNTFDYIAPSVGIARKHLAARRDGGLDPRNRGDDRGSPQDHALASKSAVAGRIISARRLDRRVAWGTKIRTSTHVDRGCWHHVAERRLS